MKNKLKPVLFVFCLFLCAIAACGQKKSTDIPQKPQLNITILIDLSDRISPEINPSKYSSHEERDLLIIEHIAKVFVEDLEKRRAALARGKIKVIFTPIPEDEDIEGEKINEVIKKLNIDLSKIPRKQAAERQQIHDELPNILVSNLKNIYKNTIDHKRWIGSDIWRFFKNDVKDLCIENITELPYRNILIILTDGYIYHQDSTHRDKNRFAYLTSKTHKNDEDIIRKILSKWFEEMGVKKGKYEIYNSEVPEITKKRIDNFINGQR